jgi:hypothetical protein
MKTLCLGRWHGILKPSPRGEPDEGLEPEFPFAYASLR